MQDRPGSMPGLAGMDWLGVTSDDTHVVQNIPAPCMHAQYGCALPACVAAGLSSARVVLMQWLVVMT